MILLSSIYASEMLSQFERGPVADASLNLGKTRTQVELREAAVCLPGEERVSLDGLRAVAACEDVVFFVQDGEVRKLILFSEVTGRTYKLRPTEDWPALEISGILMHRIKGTSPRKDAEAKLRLLAPVRGAVLDTCMGLGYTAILAAPTADAVTAVEKDENVIEMAQLNPYSQGLFTEPPPCSMGSLPVRVPPMSSQFPSVSASEQQQQQQRHGQDAHATSEITMVHADATEIVPRFREAAFDIVNHDPPTLSVAGELYSDAFYAELLRILKPGGRLLHYTGAPGSRGRRVDLSASVTRRLARVGFANVRPDPQTFCIVATRPKRRA